jgi:hypothetical protein
MKVSGWVEGLGLGAVVVSLLFVGVEIRQNTAIASAQALLDLAAAANEILLAQAEDEDLAMIVKRGDTEIQDLNDAERARFDALVVSLWNTYEAAYAYHAKGVLSSDDYQPWLATACASHQYDSDRTVLDEGHTSLNPSFMALLQRECATPD